MRLTSAFSRQYAADAQRELLVIGFAVPEELALAITASDRFASIQTYKFQDRLIRALASIGNRVQLVSTPPVTDWSTKRFIGYRRWRHSASQGCDRIYPVINLMGVKQLCVFAGCLVGAFQWVIRTFRSRRNSLIVLADIYMPHLLAAFIAARISRRKVVATITDMPGLVPLPDGWIKRLLRPLDIGSIHRLVRKLDGLILLSEHIHRDFFPRVPHLVLEGFVDADGAAVAGVAASSACVPFVVMYAGGLIRAYGLELLLETIRLVQDERFQFWVTGKGEGENEVRDAAAKDPRIRYLGFVEPARLAELQQQASILINPRPSEANFARYSFPSKVLEYMAAGVPVLTTRFPSLPPEYEEHVIIPASQDAVGLAESLRTLAQWPRWRLDDFGRHARVFVHARASIAGQGIRIDAFLASLLSPRGGADAPSLIGS